MRIAKNRNFVQFVAQQTLGKFVAERLNKNHKIYENCENYENCKKSQFS